MVAVLYEAALVRAELVMFEPPPGDDSSQPGRERLPRLPFHFNPESLSINKAGTWPRTPSPDAAKAATPQFAGSEPRTMTVEMFFDAGDNRGNVQKAVEILMSCCEPTPDSINAKRPSPPWVRLQWGRLQYFTALARSVFANYTLFAPDGVPLRARCSVQLQEMGGSVRRQNPTSGGDESAGTHEVIRGESLASLAYATYGDPTRWRDIARYNSLDDPALVSPGQRLLLPERIEATYEETP
ncbi:CIS tube protein [Streptomyces sp. CAS3]